MTEPPCSHYRTALAVITCKGPRTQVACNICISICLAPGKPEEMEIKFINRITNGRKPGAGEQYPISFADVKETHKAMAQGYSMVKGL